MSYRLCACGRAIHLSTRVNGKLKNFQHRRRCLRCLPFGMKRGRWHGIVTRTPDEASRACRERLRARYRERRLELGRCPVTAMRISRRRFVVDLVGAACQLCRYGRCKRNLVFHHVTGKKELMLSSPSFQVRLSSMVKELRKCAVVCHNCHGEIHEGLVDVWKVRRAQKLFTTKLVVLEGKTWRDLGLHYM